MTNCTIAAVAVFNERRDHPDEFTSEHDFWASRLGAGFTSHSQQVRNSDRDSNVVWIGLCTLACFLHCRCLLLMGKEFTFLCVTLKISPLPLRFRHVAKQRFYENCWLSLNSQKQNCYTVCEVFETEIRPGFLAWQKGSGLSYKLNVLGVWLAIVVELQVTKLAHFIQMWDDLHGAKSAGMGAACGVLDGKRLSTKPQHCQQELNPGMNVK